ncbi:MAG: TonB-dependent receptor, partial [Gemmatimonadota bacterium]|nr:TonB-dependent receptor [Gemmatimonadota bacterium]
MEVLACRRHHSLVPLLASLLALLFGASVGQAQTATITGRVTDAETGAPLSGTRIEARSGVAVAARAMSDDNGAFRLTALAPGAYTVAAARVGYQMRLVEAVQIGADAAVTVDIALTAIALRLAPTVVTASRQEEKALDAPASVSVVPTQAIEERPALTANDHVRGLPGVDVATTGIMQGTVVSRGFSNVFSGALLTLSDYRYAFVPSLRVNTPFLVPAVNEDISRIELVLGPGSALYGPNAASGVMHIITRSPFESRGTTVSLGGGERSIVRAALRHAGVAGERFGYKVSGQFMRGKDWEHTDPAEPAGARDFDVERWSGEARVDFRPSDNTDVIFAFGTTHAGSAIEMTGIGAAQAKDWRYDYYQARLRHGRLFGQVFLNMSDAGETFLLRTGQPIVDLSRMLVGQVQHGVSVGERQHFIYGIDAQRTDPRTEGTINGRNEDIDEISELGGYLHSETNLSPHFDFFAALRADTHSELDDPVLSPRVGIVFKPRESQNLRLTYNRAFSTPTTNNLFLDIVGGRLTPLPIDVRTVGVPSGGFQFRRDCGGAVGLCMRSNFAPDPSAFLPTDATLLWPAVVALLKQQGTDISMIPPPTGADVSTVLRALDPTTRLFNDVSATDVRDIDELR